MGSRISWEDVLWEDPDGGTILLHGTIPTLVYPRKLRPSKEWHGLALLESEEVVDLWLQEEKDEIESNGVNLAHGLISGGTMGLFLEEVMQLEDITAGRFPDPEPRRRPDPDYRAVGHAAAGDRAERHRGRRGV